VEAFDDFAVTIQAGAVPYRIDIDGSPRVLLVSSSKGYWLVPKGHVDPGETALAAAEREAAEEAGIVGRAHGEPLGTFEYEKSDGRLCRCTLFALRVSEVLEEWGEAKVRDRRWTTVPHASAAVRWPGMGALIARLPGVVRKGGNGAGAEGRGAAS